MKDYYQIKLSSSSGDTEVIAKYKKIIEDEFFPARGYGRAKLSSAKKAISEYKKISESPTDIADITIFYVEQGVKFTNAYGDIDEPFYNSMESMYEKAIDWLIKYEIQDLFQDRCKKIVKDTSGIGWGVHDMLGDLYSRAFGDK